MTIRNEIEALSTESESRGLPLTALSVVEAAKNAEMYPALNAHLWGAPEEDLAAEARINRAHRILISIRIVTESGDVSRFLMHTNNEPGYRPYSSVVVSPDLAAAKLRQLSMNIARARQQLRAFRALLDDNVATEIDDLLLRAETIATPVDDEHMAHPV